MRLSLCRRGGLVGCVGALLLASAPTLAQDPGPAKPAEPTPVPAPDKPADPPITAVKKAARPVEPATVPATRPGTWMRQHEAFVERAKKGDADLLFLGDSITAGWRAAQGVWDRYYSPRHATNFGIGGDRTQHVLWRLEHGELDGIKPKVVVLMIGTNNIGSNPDDEVANGVHAVIDSLRSKLPEAKILLLAIFPRGSNRDKTIPAIAPDPRVARINSQLATFDDGKMVKYLDIGSTFLDSEGRVHRAAMPDFLHLTPTAYAKWADAIEPTLWDMMESK